MNVTVKEIEYKKKNTKRQDRKKTRSKTKRRRDKNGRKKRTKMNELLEIATNWNLSERNDFIFVFAAGNTQYFIRTCRRQILFISLFSVSLSFSHSLLFLYICNALDDSIEDDNTHNNYHWLFSLQCQHFLLFLKFRSIFKRISRLFFSINLAFSLWRCFFSDRLSSSFNNILDYSSMLAQNVYFSVFFTIFFLSLIPVKRMKI